MYAHKLIQPQSNLVKYRGNTGQIDVQSSIIRIVSKYPGVKGSVVASLIYNKRMLPLSHGYVYKVLNRLANEKVLAKSEDGYYYIFSDAVSHDMKVTEDVVERLDALDVDLDKARFLSSGIVMFAENALAESTGKEADLGLTSAMSPFTVTNDENEVAIIFADDDDDDDENEVAIIFADDDDDDDENEVAIIFADDEDEPINPFKEMTEDERTALKESVKDRIQKEYDEEIEQNRVISENAKKKTEREKLSSFTTVESLLGANVEINIPGKSTGRVIATILELRPTGVTFLVIFSEDPSIQEGTVFPIEYSQSISYRILSDFNLEDQF